MNRRYMPADHGMLFEFPSDAPVAFWMKNTYIPLDMIFLSRSGVVTNVVANAEPLSERVIPSGPPCAAVLEVNGGVAAAIGVKVGDRVRQGFSSLDRSNGSRRLHCPATLLHSQTNTAGRMRFDRRRYPRF